MEIKKKCWPEYFQLILNGKKNVEVRLADFELKEGDVLIMEEFDPETNTYTGRKIKKKAQSIIKFNPTRMHRPEEIKKFGFYIIELK
jgi:ASC-1-like (ASCH) protein